MNAVAPVNHGSAVAVQNGYDPFASYGAEAASGGGDFLKFNKGEWTKGQNDDEVELGTRLAANMSELSIGWIRWDGGKPAERRMGLLAQAFRPELRDALGYNDQDEWETDGDGKPIDPWTFTNELPVADPESGDQMTISMSSKGGIGAIGNLCKAYAKEYQARPGEVPIIELARNSYIHPQYKKVWVPVLNIVDWVENGSVPEPQSKSEDDEEEKPVAAKATGSKARF